MSIWVLSLNLNLRLWKLKLKSLIGVAGFIHAVKYLLKSSFFSYSYWQHYHNRLYINLLGENRFFYVKSDIEHNTITTPLRIFDCEKASNLQLFGVTPRIVYAQSLALLKVTIMNVTDLLFIMLQNLLVSNKSLCEEPVCGLQLGL